MISLDSARAVLLAGVAPLDAEDVALGDALGRVLAGALVAGADQPALRTSAMDGYAVTAGDAVSGARLTVAGQAYAGAPFARAMTAGEAVRIATGGVVPDGAARVVMQEIVRRDGDFIVIGGPVHEATFVRPAGGDYRAGDALLAAGEVISAARLGLAASAGAATLAVRRCPRVAIFASGDELRQPGEPLAPGEVVDSASVALAALVGQWGGRAERKPVLPDDFDRARAMIGDARDADLIVLIGGASVGDRDVLRAAVADLGGRLQFERIAVQPGKPSWHARFDDGRLVLGLPGNPASAFVCAHLLLEPLIAAMLGRSSRCQARPALLAEALAPNGERDTYWRAHLALDAAGRWIVTPDRRGDSSLQRPLATANALLRQPAGAALSRGEVVDTIVLD